MCDLGPKPIEVSKRCISLDTNKRFIVQTECGTTNNMPQCMMHPEHSHNMYV